MSWITIVWSMNAAACLTLAAFYCAVWCKQRGNWLYVVFSCSAIAAAGISALELGMLNAQTAERYQVLTRWIHVPTWVLTVSFVAFVRLYFHAGRTWLAWSICGLRTLVLILNFISPVSINFRTITDIRDFSWGGEIVSVPVGLPNPWGLISSFSLLLLLIFAVDATITVWRRGDRRRALFVGGSMIFGAVLAWHVPLVIWGIAEVPFFLGFTYTATVAAMGYELSNDMARAARLAHELEASMTERRLAEERFHLVVEAAPVAIIMANREGRITFMNTRVKALFGYTRDELIGQPIELLVPQRFRSPHVGYRHGYFCDPKARPMGAGRDLFGRRKDGTEVPVEIALSPVHTAEGPSVLASIVDISERKQAELEAARQRDELSHFNRVATLGEMSASLVHELNQPLTAILNNASAGARFIDRGDVNLAELRELLADIAADGRRAGDVIRAVRSMVKKGQTARERMDVNELVTNVVRLVTPDASLRNCEVKTSLQPDLPAIEGDPIQFEQVLLNLIVNAFEAMRDTPVSSRKIMIATGSHDNGAIQISVRDFGVGIAEEARERLFEQFFTTKADGLGMGLAIARTIVESNAGTIRAEDAEGGGARFCFTFPAIAAASK